jgi:hypothetical protein
MRKKMTCVGAVLILGLLMASCKPEGTFGFRKFGEDTYHRLHDTPEFSSVEAVDWVFVFKKQYGDHVIGVIYQKKELVWVDLLTTTGKISKESKVVYGTIKDLEPGEYRIVLTDVGDDNKLINSKDFTVYEKEDEDTVE